MVLPELPQRTRNHQEYRVFSTCISQIKKLVEMISAHGQLRKLRLKGKVSVNVYTAFVTSLTIFVAAASYENKDRYRAESVAERGVS